MGQLKAFGDSRQVPVSVASADESTARRTVGLLNLISIEANMANACHPPRGWLPPVRGFAIDGAGNNSLVLELDRLFQNRHINRRVTWAGRVVRCRSDHLQSRTFSRETPNVASSLLALLDDIAVLTKVAAKKTAGVLGDDLALNAEQVAGVDSDRELLVVWVVAKGSMLNKAILVPAALLLSAFVPLAVIPLMMIGGAFLCF